MCVAAHRFVRAHVQTLEAQAKRGKRASKRARQERGCEAQQPSRPFISRGHRHSPLNLSSGRAPLASSLSAVFYLVLPPPSAFPFPPLTPHSFSHLALHDDNALFVGQPCEALPRQEKKDVHIPRERRVKRSSSNQFRDGHLRQTRQSADTLVHTAGKLLPCTIHLPSSVASHICNM